MVCFRSLSRVVGTLANGRTSWLINRGDPNHLLAGMILQVTVDVRGAEQKSLVKTSEALRADRLEAWTRSSETTVRGGVAGLGRCVWYTP